MANSPQLQSIHPAFCDDDADTVRSILATSPEVRARINDPVFAFDSPAIHHVKSREVLDVMLDAGADINARSKWWAGGFGLLDLVEPELAAYAIERGARVDAHSAARLGLLDTLTNLIDADPSVVDSPGGDGQTPLHFASTKEVAQLLLDHGADIDAKDLDHESTPAQWMVANRQDVAQYLVNRGCTTDLLMVSALGDDELVSEAIIQKPESIRMRVTNEWFPMTRIRSGGTIYQWELGWYVSAHQVAHRFGHQEILHLLQKRSPDDVNLLNACWLGDEATVLALRPAVKDLSESDRQHLAHAARNDDIEAVRLMLVAGLPLNGRSQHGATALHWAAWNGNRDMVRILLDAGADVTDSKNDFFSTALGWAIHASTEGCHPDRGDYAGIVEDLLAGGSKLPDSANGSPAVREVLAQHGLR